MEKLIPLAAFFAMLLAAVCICGMLIIGGVVA